ncbi:hypothetical protein IWQ61_008696 [Dispira simplex]|nr:hypothetical protein IWQ61_008696 [Dispira simplex]
MSSQVVIPQRSASVPTVVSLSILPQPSRDGSTKSTGTSGTIYRSSRKLLRYVRKRVSNRPVPTAITVPNSQYVLDTTPTSSPDSSTLGLNRVTLPIRTTSLGRSPTSPPSDVPYHLTNYTEEMINTGQQFRDTDQGEHSGHSVLDSGSCLTLVQAALSGDDPQTNFSSSPVATGIPTLLYQPVAVPGPTAMGRRSRSYDSADVHALLQHQRRIPSSNPFLDVEIPTADQLFYMATNYLIGTSNFSIDQAQAVSYLTLAHQQDHSMATAVLGICYEFGLGVDINYPLAEEYYLQVADKGCVLAQARMAFFRKFGRPGVQINQTEGKQWQKAVSHQGVSGLGWVEMAARAGTQPVFQYVLGLCYLDGLGYAKDTKAAIRWLRLAADQGMERAQSVLGYCYIEGIGVTKSVDKALRWYIRATEKGELMAIYNLGYCHEYGIGVERDVVRAAQLYRTAAVQGCAFAQNSLGYCYEDGIGVPKDPHLAAHWYGCSAEQGYPWAQCNLGYCYQYGIGVTQDYTTGARWYLRAAEQGYSRAQHNIGFCYQNGIGVEKNGDTAFFWYKRSADQGNVFAYHSLGYCYQYGTGTDVDLPKAVKWYTKAAEENHAPAQLSLGYCYRNGIGVTKNLFEAFDWFHQAAQQGNHLAQNSLGYCYEEGLGVDANPQLAFKWYAASAAQNNAWAQCNVGQCYFTGMGVAKDYNRATQWFQRAARQGLSRAQYKLGYCYLHGLGTTINERQAFKWYQKAAQQDYAAAILHVATCYEQGVGVTRDVQQAMTWLQRGSALGDFTASERLRELLIRTCFHQLKEDSRYNSSASPIARCA